MSKMTKYLVCVGLNKYVEASNKYIYTVQVAIYHGKM